MFSPKQQIISSSLRDRPNTKSYRHPFRIVGIQDRHCCVGHSFGGRCFSYGATRICSACTVYSFGGGVGIVELADSRRQLLPGRPVPCLFQLRQGVSKFKFWLRVSQGVLWPDISYLHPLREIESKNQPNPFINKKVWFLTLLEFSKPKIIPTPIQNSQNLR